MRTYPKKVSSPRVRRPIAISALLLLTACSGTSTWQAAEPEATNTAVAAMLPQGTFRVVGEWRDHESQIVSSIEGYVSFGAAPDGADCESEYTLTAGQRGVEAEWLTTKQRWVRTAGGPAWLRDESNPGSPGTWYDHLAPDAPSLPFMPGWDISPNASLAVEGAGAGALCAIPVAARYMSPAPLPEQATESLDNDVDELVYDQRRAAAIFVAGEERWWEKVVDAAGITGTRRDEALKKLTEGLWTVAYALSKRRVVISRENDNIVMTEYTKLGPCENCIEGELVLRLTFTSTAPRPVERVVADTFFERVSAGLENSQKSGWEYLQDAYDL